MKRPVRSDEHEPISIRLQAYEDAPHRLVRLAAVAAALGESLLARCAGLRDEKGILTVVERIEWQEADRAFARRAWAEVGHESQQDVEFEVEGEER